ncbi:MAG: hypothetical protein V6Z81_08570 [Parvularculales bacterium]
MAKRPVFIPDFSKQNLSKEQMFEFIWSGGFAEVQKKKNIKALHEAAAKNGIKSILEVSTKSEEEIGQKLSAFNLKYQIGEKFYPLESVYQGSKVFEEGGPFKQVFELEPREARKFIRELNYDKLKAYELEGKTYPLTPFNAFYDWLYIRSLADHAKWIKSNVKHEAFTDIEFNPKKQFNCQARALAEYLSLLKKNKLSEAVSNFDVFQSMLSTI